jgi:flavin reductase (DIM6/NTAB) family NADH-FMN oxidoreductase RutF
MWDRLRQTVLLDKITAAEWTHHVSYSPSMIAINIRGDDDTARNIESSKEFGVNIAAIAQSIICRYTGKEIDEISLPKEAGIIPRESMY